MRLPIRSNYYQLGAATALLISFLFLNYQKFDLPALLPFAPPMDKKETSSLSRIFLFVSLFFSTVNIKISIGNSQNREHPSWHQIYITRALLIIIGFILICMLVFPF